MKHSNHWLSLVLATSGCTGVINAGGGGGMAPTVAPALNTLSSFDEPTAIFSSTDSEAFAFECLVTGGAWFDCTSPLDLTTVSGVDRGFVGEITVRAVNLMGKAGPESVKAFRRSTVPQGWLGTSVNAIKGLSDGRVLFAGEFGAGQGYPTMGFGLLNSVGALVPKIDTFNNTANVVRIQSDGKFLLGGGFTTYGGVAALYLARLNADGSLDTSFTSNMGTGLNGAVNTIAIQSDGKILVGGSFTSLNGDATKPDSLLRFNSDGTLDTAFATALGAGFGGIGKHIKDIVIQPDGMILVSGNFGSLDGNTVPFNLIRLEADGDVDPSAFTTNLGVGMVGFANAVGLQSDGKIILGGTISEFGGVTGLPNIARLNTDGTVDATFDSVLGTGFNGNIHGLLVQSDDKIIVGGDFTSFNGGAGAPDRVFRLEADGTADTTFATNAGTGFNQTVKSFAVQSDGKIIVTGAFTTFSGVAAPMLARLNADGSRDTALPAVSTDVFNDTGLSVSITANGNLAAAGTFTRFGLPLNQPADLSMFKADGTIDTDFLLNAGTGFNQGITSAAEMPDGSLMFGGNFTSFNGDSSKPNFTMSLNPDGTPNSTFVTNVNGGFTAGLSVYALAPSLAGGALLVGNFWQFATSLSRSYLIRLYPDGSEDTSAGTHGLDNWTYSVAQQSDGKVYFGGQFTAYDGVAGTPNCLLRVNADGSPDTTFNANLGTGCGATQKVSIIKVLSNNKILVGGQITTLNSVTVPTNIFLLNADGTLNSSFNSNLGTGLTNSFIPEVNVIAEQSDGKILVGGKFTDFNGNASAPDALIRLNADGSLDSDFTANLGTGFNNEVKALYVDSAGKIYVGGAFTSWNGESANKALVLKPDGTRYPYLLGNGL